MAGIIRIIDLVVDIQTLCSAEDINVRSTIIGGVPWWVDSVLVGLDAGIWCLGALGFWVSKVLDDGNINVDV